MDHLTPIVFEERSGLDRRDEPVMLGIPFPQGKIDHRGNLVLVSREGNSVPLQVEVLNTWADRSVKWAVLDFLANVKARTVAQYELYYTTSQDISVMRHSPLIIQRSSNAIVINTGYAEFVINPITFKPFESVRIRGKTHLTQTGSRIVLIGETGQEYEPRIDSIVVESHGTVRATLVVRGCFGSTPEIAFANFLARLNFRADSGLVEMQLTLHNPRAALHPGGLWDLGDEGSIFFRDMSLYAEIAGHEPIAALWKSEPEGMAAERIVRSLEIYQDSSGGQNWQSTNHVNRDGRVTTQFCGYRVVVDGDLVKLGKRALPTISVRSEEKTITGAISGFWQNFPKALEVKDRQLVLRLFPAQCGDLYELQGGEQKTHVCFLGMQSGEDFSLDWIHDRLLPRIQPEWYAESKAFCYISPRELTLKDTETFELAEQLVDTAISGDSTFFDRREIIDEYGWRHFGDLYADHEAVGWKGKQPLVAHYNNQYDVVYGTLAQYIRSGNPLWFQLADDLAKHVIDIDIYHTREDRPEFNGGLFWHTDHYKDAATATHRTYSKVNLGPRTVNEYGGGPSNEHNYTTGLMYYYFITGNMLAKEAVQSLADWVINLDAGRNDLLNWFDSRPSGRCSATVDREYHGPGRGCGNSINALLDAYCLTQENRYLAKAEVLIQRCVHPRDDIATRNLGDIEHRWSYLVFLQVLGKYLDVKSELGSLDYMFAYARDSLLHYARWMLDHEALYSTLLDKVEIPTETWPAQDIRKSVVFSFAAKYADEPLHGQCVARARYFFDAGVRDLLVFPTCRLTRPVVLLMTNGFIHAYSYAHTSDRAPRNNIDYAFGQPKKFRPQLTELYRARELLRAGVKRLKERKQRLLQRVSQFCQPVGDRHG